MNLMNLQFPAMIGKVKFQYVSRTQTLHLKCGHVNVFLIEIKQTKTGHTDSYRLIY